MIFACTRLPASSMRRRGSAAASVAWSYPQRVQRGIADYEHRVAQESGTGELRITPSSVLAAATGTAGGSGA